MKVNFTLFICLLSLSPFTTNAQKVSKLTITDNLNMTGRFTLLVHPALKFTAYKDQNGKSEWVVDKIIDVKQDATYVMTAFNFFTTGAFKIIITPEESKDVLAQGDFTITK